METTMESRGIYRGKPHGSSRGKSQQAKGRGIPRDSRWEHDGAQGGSYRNTFAHVGSHLASRGTPRGPMGSSAGYRGMPRWDPVASYSTPTRFHGRDPKGSHPELQRDVP